MAETKEQKKERMRVWREANRDRLVAAAKERWANMTPEQREAKAEADRQYRLRNAERIDERRAKYREENREMIRERARQYYKEKPECFVLHNIKTRAKRQGVPFDLSAEDIETPEFCPVLGIRLERSTNPNGGVTDCSPTVDRLIPELGYVKGNVIVVSHKANRIKNDATVEELEAVAYFYRNLFTVKELNKKGASNGDDDSHVVHGP